jgi:hypothetical protein
MGLLLLLGGGSRPRGILDTYSGAAGAYSVRLLRQGYSGAAMRVRRSSDNAETDIGFLDNGDLNTAALTAFCGAGDGFVATWYDQTTNGRNASQSTTTNQPQIVSSGSLITQNSKAAVQYDGSGDTLALSGITSTPWSFFFVGVATGTLGGIFGHPANSHGFCYHKSVTGYGYWSNTYNMRVGVGSGQDLATIIVDATNGSGWRNGVAGTVGTPLTSNAGYTLSRIGYNFVGANFEGKIQELVVWTSDESSNRAGVESNMNTYFGVY